MGNPFANSRFLLGMVAALFSIHHVYCGGSGSGSGSGREEAQWQMLSKSNFSYHIHHHPHLLLLVTVPWSGESRSFMTELAHAVASDQVRFGTLKLMVLYKNIERMLADVLGALEGVTIFYYHNAISYKYWGKVRVQSILSSVHYVMSLSPNELPLKFLTTPEELRDFLDSTDKAVLLLEFCGWVPKLLATDKNAMEDDIAKCHHEADLYGENNGTFAVKEKNDIKGIGDDKLNCRIDNVIGGFSWLSQFTSVNDSLVKEAENLTFSFGDSCSLDEFQHFELFLQKFIKVSREFFLPHERHRFALIHDKSLLSLLNIEETGSWSMMVYFAGCPGCSKVFREVDELRTVLKIHPSPVLELEDEFHGVEVTFHPKRSIVLLFVDRSSESPQIRTESQGALSAFRELAQQYEMSNQIHGLATLRNDKPSTKTDRASWSTLKHPKLQPFLASQNLLKDKMSVMVLNEGKQVTTEYLFSDLQGTSAHDILTFALNQKKEITLSSYAKDAGFQLLSKDFDIEVVESLPPPSAVKSDQVLGEPPVEGILKNTVNVDKNRMPAVTSSGQHEELSNPSDAEYILLEDKEVSSGENSQSPVKSDNSHRYMGIATGIGAQDWNVETRFTEMDDNLQQRDFRGSFFFIDGQYRLLETLTGGSKIPSVVIIDPISQKYYVMAEQSALSYSLLFNFVNNFLRGKLLPYQLPAPTVPSPREAPRPPFVNLDYHEKDSIPLLTTHTFSDLVLGNKSDPKSSGRSWDTNILVLFSNSWCGFCHRMELVVREVYRAILGYANLKMNSSRMEKLLLTEYFEDSALRLPFIYMMDCTQNDCGLIMKPILQKEFYPLLLLFPAENKKKTVPYEGDIAVSDIIKFLFTHGSHVQDLCIDKSYLLDHCPVKQVPVVGSLPNEVPLKDRLQNVGVEHNHVSAQFPVGSYERPQLSIGCILGATEKVLDILPFDESKILLVKVEERIGFQGLIINKHISWDTFEEGFDLLKDAPLSFGGPVVRRGMSLVALTFNYIENQSVEILPDIYFVDQRATQSLIEEIRVGKQSVGDFWFFLGYSSWGWDQLFHEIAQGAWNVSNGNLEKLEWPRK